MSLIRSCKLLSIPQLCSKDNKIEKSTKNKSANLERNYNNEIREIKISGIETNRYQIIIIKYLNIATVEVISSKHF